MERFLTHWLRGFERALERIDPASRSAILRECGRACADSYTAAVFVDAKKRSTDLEGFVANLSLAFPKAEFTLVDERTLRARYATCGCDLVADGPIRSPHLCDCSAFNLQENVERALGVQAAVTIEATILRGAERCELVVTWTGRPRWSAA